jgi:hypothetical protein
MPGELSITVPKPDKPEKSICVCGRVKVLEADKRITWQIVPPCFQAHCETKGYRIVFQQCPLCKN